MNHRVVCLFIRVHRKYRQKVTDRQSLRQKFFESGVGLSSGLQARTDIIKYIGGVQIAKCGRDAVP